VVVICGKCDEVAWQNFVILVCNSICYVVQFCDKHDIRRSTLL